MRLCRPNAAQANVGPPTDSYTIQPFAVIGGNKVLAGDQIGGIAETQQLLEFCAEHGLGATIETLDASDTRTIDQAYDDVVAGKVRYRYVIDTSTINPG